MRLLLRLQVVVSVLLAALVYGAMGVGAAWPGDEIAFTVRRDCCQSIHVLDVRAGIERLFPLESQNVYAPSWSPDGRHIAFIATRGNEPEAILCMAEAGGANRRCTSARGKKLRPPSWSPDGTRIAFVGNQGIFTLDTNTFAQPSILLEGDFNYAAWSPDGSQIGYVATLEGVTGIHILDLNTTESRWVANGHDLAWSPDGTQLAYADGWEIMIVPAQEGTPVYVTDGLDPDWSPDGEWLAFYRGGTSLSDLMLRHVASGREITLVSNGFSIASPSWRPW